MAETYSYDVFLVSSLDDVGFADMVAKRLRALKMKVWFDKNRDSRTLSAKDARSLEKSRNLLVLWSKSADESDWVHAAARTGRSRGILIQTAIDDVVPRDPFQLDDRIDLAGLTAKSAGPGYESLIGALAKAQGRPGLVSFIGLDAKNRAAWLKKYKADPIALAAAPKAAPAAYLSDMRARTQEWADWTTDKASGLPPGVPDDLNLVGGIADQLKAGLATAGITSISALAMLKDDQITSLETALGVRKGRILREEWVEQARELLQGLPPRAKADLPLWTKSQADYVPPVAVAPVAATPVAAFAPPPSNDHLKIGIVTAILACIAVMFFFGWLFGRDERAAGAFGLTNSCPAGQYPVALTPLT